MRLFEGIKGYVSNIYESVTTVSMGMWVTFKTAFFERKMTLQYPSHDILEGETKEASISAKASLNPSFEPFLGASQQKYRGPLNARLPERYRGLLGYDEPSCISCLLCALNCPIDVIRVKGVKIDGRRGKAPTTFRIDYSKCMFCGLCVEVCPTDAVFFTRQFEGATFSYRTLVREFISPQLSLERLQLAEEAKKNAIKKKMKSEKKDSQTQ